MKTSQPRLTLLFTALFCFCAPFSGSASEPRAAFWVDLLSGQPVGDEKDLWEDLATVDVVFIGETHRLERHHALQREIVSHLLASGRPVLLGLEQIEARNQLQLDLLNRGEIDFATFAERIHWKEQWQNFEDYREVILTALRGGGRVVGLNAPREIIRQVGKSGLDSLSAEQRSALPAVLHTDDPTYEKLMNQLLSVHSMFDPKFLRHVFEAQVSRDDTMASTLVDALAAWKPANDKPPLAVVITGSGHVQFGLGVPDRVGWKNSKILARILLLSESGDTVLTNAEKAMSREIQIRHGDLSFIRRSIADYLHVKEWNSGPSPR